MRLATLRNAQIPLSFCDDDMITMILFATIWPRSLLLIFWGFWYNWQEPQKVQPLDEVKQTRLVKNVEDEGEDRQEFKKINPT